MTDAEDAARLVLATPPRGDIEAVAAALPAALATGLVATVRLDLPGASDAEARRAADRLREICHAADVAIVIRDHVGLVAPLGLDGVQVSLPGASLKKVRAAIGPDAILGVDCGASRHDGMTAGEAGADYVLFSPVVPEPAAGPVEPAPLELFQWWAQMIEVPVVAEGGVDVAQAKALGPYADFAVPAPSVWEGDLVANLKALDAALRG
ncbi:thiamine phosphate synthase [Albimonas sp. CAU 1670]|uniref:thiamine phosphate synthase n=1 Tax=Albimonas sp. CAU 1670 TaxID=3032599 RepID=UPI0023DA1298|nr:thiamine phosphate synthase [Albimonas sp. CAU 1670]MDF2232105.1 thiamine phosphate synthase [Albimonas sp. CAU 1670]